jgi:mannose-6-phosphate isomerase-like protein (cupin superfamily)
MCNQIDVGWFFAVATKYSNGERRRETEQRNRATQVETAQREVVHLEDAHTRPMMGLDILEPMPSRSIPYEQVDPFILVHEGVVPISPERAAFDTTHPHRGFDNLWYVLSGEASTGHSTGPGGTFERARLRPGSLRKLRTGRGVYHAESTGEEELREGKAGTEFRGVLFWVNLARKDKHVEPTSQLRNRTTFPRARRATRSSESWWARALRWSSGHPD